MNIISSYSNSGKKIVYKSFECELDLNTTLRFEFLEKEEEEEDIEQGTEQENPSDTEEDGTIEEEAQEVTNEKRGQATLVDKASGNVITTLYVDSSDMRILIDTLRVVTRQLEELELEDSTEE